jgi:hypothetical protein
MSAAPTPNRPPAFRTVWQRAVCIADISATAKLVAFVIGAHMDPMGRAWPSKETIATEAGWNDRSTVTPRLKELRKAGLLEVQTGGGRGRSNVYQARIPVLLSTRLAAKGVLTSTERGPETRVNGTSGAPGSSYEVHTEERLAALDDLNLIKAPNPSDDLVVADAS